MHDAPHPQAGRTVTVNYHGVDGETRVLEYTIEDWWDRVNGNPWELSVLAGNISAINYAIRVESTGLLPRDDDVVYGKVAYFGYLVHATEIAT